MEKGTTISAQQAEARWGMPRIVGDGPRRVRAFRTVLDENGLWEPVFGEGPVWIGHRLSATAKEVAEAEAAQQELRRAWDKRAAERTARVLRGLEPEDGAAVMEALDECNGWIGEGCGDLAEVVSALRSLPEGTRGRLAAAILAGPVEE